MAFVGIGGGVNLGAATGYLFIDGSGMRRGLSQSEQALKSFEDATAKRAQVVAQAAARNAAALTDTANRAAEVQAKVMQRVTEAQANRAKAISQTVAQEQQKIAALQQKAAQAATQAQRTQVFTDPTQQQRLTQLASDVADANKRATDVIEQGYQRRKDAVTKAATVEETQNARVVAAEQAVTDSMAKQAAATARLAQIEADLAAATDLRVKRQLGGQKTQGLRKAKIANTDVAAAEQALVQISADVANTIAGAHDVAKNEILRSLSDETAALNVSRTAIQAQATEFQRLAAIAGPSVANAAAAVEKSAQRVVNAGSRVAQINDKLAQHRATTANLSGVELERAAAKESKLLNQRLQAINTLDNANADYVRKAGQFSDRLAQIGLSDAQNAQKSAQALVDAQVAGRAKVATTVAEQNAKVLAAEKAGQDAMTADAAKGSAQRVQIAEAEAAKVIAAEEELAAARKGARQQASATAMKGATVASIALGAAVFASTSAFVSFDEQMHNVASISDNVDNALGSMRDHVLALSRELGQSPDELAKALYDIVSSGFDGADALRLLDASARAATAGMSSVATTGKSLTAVINAYKNANEKVRLSINEVGKVSDIAFQAVKDGVFSFEELTQQQGDNLSIAAELQVSYEELAASYVVLTKAGNSLSESTTQVNGILRTFLKPNEDLKNAIRAYGEEVLHVTDLTGASLIQNYGFGAALEFVSKATHGSADELGKLFPNVRALRGEVGLGGRNLAEYNLELLRMQKAGQEGTATQRALSIQMQSAAFQMRQVREEFRSTAIILGGTFAPGILIAAKGLGQLAQGFNALPSDLQSVVGGAIGFSTALLVGFVVIGKMVGAVRNARKEFGLLKIAIRDSANAMRIWTVVSNPLFLIAAAVGVVTLAVINSHKKQREAAKALEQAYKDLNVTINSLKDAGDITAGEAIAADELKASLQGVIDARKDSLGVLEDEYSTLKNLLDLPLARVSGVDFNDQHLSFDEANKMLDEYSALILQISGESDDATAALDLLNNVLLIQGINIQQVTDFLQPYIEEFRSTGDLKAFAEHLQFIISNQNQFKGSTSDATAKVAELGDSLDSLDEFFGSADEKADNFRKGMQGLVQTMETAIGAADDFSSPLAFIQQRMGLLGNTSAETLLILQKMGHLSLTDAQQQGLAAAAAMERWQAEIDKVNASIQQNQTAMSQWQSIQSLVSDTVGTEADGFARLNDMVARHKITQDDANKIKEAAIFLNERSAAGIEDERVAIAKSLPDLAAFVNEHDLAVTAYDTLSPEARGFADALKDARTQAVLMTIIMAKLANALNDKVFPDEFLTKMILDVTQFDPVMGAVLDEFGLIPEELKTEIQITKVPETIQEVKDIRGKVVDLLAKIRANPFASPEDLAKAKQYESILDELDRKELSLTVGVQTDPLNALPDLQHEITDTVGAGQDALDQLKQAFDDTTGSAKNTTEAIAGVLPELIRISTGAPDFSQPFEFLKKQTNSVGDSFAGMLLKAEQMNAITFTPAERSALQLQNRIDGIDQVLTKLDDEIQNNQSDMQMWQGRIDLIDATIGTATDTYAEYEAQLASGQITQEQFNAAVASGEAHRAYAELNQLVAAGKLTEKQAADIKLHAIHLRERSVGGILDERAAIALSIIDLDNYVTAHDNAARKTKDLTTEQRGFLAALKDTSVQTALNTFLMLSFLEAMNQLPKGTAKNFAEVAAAENDAVGAIFDDLGILGEGVDIPIVTDTTQATNDINKVKDVAAAPVTFPVQAQFTDATGGPVAVESQQSVPDQTFDVTANTDPATKAIDVLTQHAKDQIALMLEAGTSMGESWVNGAIAGLAFTSPDLDTSISAIVSRLDRQDDARRLGGFAGQSYDYGVAEGVYRYSSTVASAGSYLGLVLHFSMMGALLARSPSKKGALAGQSYVQGVVFGLRSEEDNARKQAASLAKSINEGFGQEAARFKALGANDMLGGRPLGTTSGTSPLVPRPTTANRTSVQHITVGDIHNEINGAGDPKAVSREIADSMWDQLMGSFRRLESAVG